MTFYAPIYFPIKAQQAYWRPNGIWNAMQIILESITTVDYSFTPSFDASINVISKARNSNQ